MNTKYFKLIILFFVIAFTSMQLKSQGFEIPKRYTGHKHRGFYLSISPGGNNTNVTVDSKHYGYTTYKGLGSGLDLKIGGAINESFILHATIMGHGVTGPKIDSDDWQINNVKTDNKLSFSEMLIGAGFTYYNSLNYLVSVSMGIGFFTLENEREDIDVSSDPGFGFQLKFGKEWWVSPKWALGIAMYYHNTSCINQKGNYAEEKINSNNLGVLLSATMNGRR